MRIAICDNNVLSRNQFLEAMHEADPKERPECFSSGAELLEAAKKAPVFDLVFLEVILPAESGVDIAAKLQSLSPQTEIVFISHSVDHAVKAYSLNALHYLLKPVTAEDVKESLRRLEQSRPKPRSLLSLVIGRENHVLYQDNISYIISIRHAKEIHLTDGRAVCVWMSFKELEKRLDPKFQKLNKGTIVNMEQISVMSKDSCLLRDGTRLAISRRERETVRQAYSHFADQC